MAFQTLVAGVDCTAAIDLNSVQVQNTLLLKSDTMNFDLLTDAVAYPRPASGNEIVFTNAGDREFAGVIASVEEEALNPSVLTYHVTAKDYTQWFDHHLVQEEYPAQAADVTVKAIVQSYANASGVVFTTTNVHPAFIVADQKFPFVYPSEAIKTLADLIEWGFYIDYNRDVHFYPLEAALSPLPGNILDLDNDLSSYHDCLLREDISQLKNRIYLRGFKTRSTGTQPVHAVGDGVSTWFPIGYPPWSVDPADITVNLNGVPQTVLTDTKDGQPGDGQTNAGAYVCFDNMGIRFNAPPTNGAVISGSFYQRTDAGTAVDDPDSQALIAAREATDGIYEHAIEDPSLTAPTLDTANARAQMLLYKYGYPKLTGSFGSYLQGWRAGQRFTVKAAKRMGGLNQLMYVTKVVKRIVSAGGEDRLHYDVSISDSPYVT